MKYQVKFSPKVETIYDSLPRHIKNMVDLIRSWLEDDPYGYGSTGNSTSRSVDHGTILLHYNIDNSHASVYVITITSIHFETGLD